MMRCLTQRPIYSIFYAISLTLCFLAFKQGDLTHTYTSSYAYLNGHFYDFYEYNKIYMGGNDYLPSMYVIFALWAFPLKLLGLMTSPESGFPGWQVSTPLEIFWFKVLLMLFFFACVALVGSIAKLIEPKVKDNAVSPALLFASSPIALFAIFIFSQYDIIGTFFTLLGLNAYFQKRFWRFAMFFSVAISFKYFAAVIYLPLVLLVAKRPAHLIRYAVVGLLVTIIQVGLYWHSDIFQNSFLALAERKTGEGIHHTKPIYLGVLYVLLCAYAYFSRLKAGLESKTWVQNALMLCILAYGLLFTHVNWHPQWIIILMPFFALFTPYIRHQKSFICFEVLGYIAFIWLCVNWFPENVDVTMVLHGVLGSYMPALTYFGASVLPRFGVTTARAIFYIYLFSPFIFWIYENWALIQDKFNVAVKQSIFPNFLKADQNSQTVNQSEISQASFDFWRLYGLRVLVACYLFLGMTAICLLRSSAYSVV